MIFELFFAMPRKSFLIFLLYVFILSGCTTYNAATGQNEFIFISTQEEIALGNQAHHDFEEKYSFDMSNEFSKKIQEIGQKLAMVSDRQDYAYHFYVIQKDDLNAFTTPGGNIYFNTGLIKRLKTNDEIAFVLAHEIGHCVARHVIKKYQAALGYNLLGSIVMNQVQGAGAGTGTQQAVNLSSSVLGNLVFSAYGRQDELESDRLAIKYMILAGYEPQGAIQALEILQAEAKGKNVPEILRTHPHVDKRIEKVRDVIPELIQHYGK